MECIICFEEKPLELIVFFPCSHYVCIDCFQQLLNFHTRPLCPICRNLILADMPLNLQEPIQETTREPTCTRRMLITLIMSGVIGLIFGASKLL